MPLYIRFVNRQAVVDQYFVAMNSKVKRGTKIISINGKSIDEIVRHIYPLMPTDGFTANPIYNNLRGLNFVFYYFLVFGNVKGGFTVEFQDQETKNIFKENTDPIPLEFFLDKKNQRLKSVEPFSFEKYKMIILNDSVAHYSIPSFRIDETEYADWLEENFRKIDSAGIKHLIIDVQANSGGMEGEENLLPTI